MPIGTVTLGRSGRDHPPHRARLRESHMQRVTLNDAVERIPDGATLMIGGFMGVGSPERVIDELVRQGKRDLTVIANDTAWPGRGIGKLVDAKLVSHTIA